MHLQTAVTGQYTPRRFVRLFRFGRNHRTSANKSSVLLENGHARSVESRKPNAMTERQRDDLLKSYIFDKRSIDLSPTTKRVRKSRAIITPTRLRHECRGENDNNFV